MSSFAGPFQQVGLVVRDLSTAITHWTQCLGVGPFVTMPEMEFENYHYYGQEMDSPVVTLAFAQSGALQIELIQQHDERPSAYLDFLKAGNDGVQHICAWPESTQEFDERRASLLARGLKIAHEGAAKGSGLRFAYFTNSDSLATPLLEISEGNLPIVQPVWRKLRSLAENWDGRQAIIPMEDLLS